MDSQKSDHDGITRRLRKLEKRLTGFGKNPGWLETFKALSTFFGSLIIAGAGLWATHTFNEKQLEVTQKQANAQMEVTKEQSNAQTIISRNKDMAGIITNLGSSDDKARRMAAIALSLYGKDAVPVLMATLSDENNEVAEAAERSLAAIGDDVSEQLIKVINDEKADDIIKGRVLYILGLRNHPQAASLARSMLQGSTKSSLQDQKKAYLYSNAVQVIRRLKDRQSINILIEVLKLNPGLDITRQIVRALGEIGDPAAEDDLKKLLNHPDEDTLVLAVWAYARVAGERALENLSEVKNRTKSTRIQTAVDDAINAYVRANAQP